MSNADAIAAAIKQAGDDGFVSGIMLMLIIGLPAIAAVLYWIINGFSVSSRACRAYDKRRDRLAADYMALGLPPASAFDRATTEMRNEATAALAVTT